MIYSLARAPITTTAAVVAKLLPIYAKRLLSNPFYTFLDGIFKIVRLRKLIVFRLRMYLKIDHHEIYETPIITLPSRVDTSKL